MWVARAAACGLWLSCEGERGRGEGGEEFCISSRRYPRERNTCAIVFTNVSRLYIPGVFRPKNKSLPPSLPPPLPPSTSPLHPLVDPPTVGRGQNPHQPSRQGGAAGWVRVLGEDGQRPAHLRGLPG